ncbi:amidohydrolase/deacetylase family metallohydrolase [Salibacterium aidingense]|uniref:amidohydrolase/deacetylase family metallohydrolase n=1 Tax=Salibacterium aidingense TaxID=384933 RepID=UPI003BEB4C73
MQVNVLDPLKEREYKAVLEVNENHCHLKKGDSRMDNQHPELYLSPGWIDIHTHVFDAFTQISVPADEAGLKKGVHIVADAGSAGEATLPGLRKYIIPQSKTNIKVWLNISSQGLVHLKEVSELRFINVEKTLEAIEQHKDIICGVKVRASGAIVEEMGTQPLKLAKLVAKEAGLPLMVHIGEAPPVIEDVLDQLSEGDVITHVYHGKVGHPWNQNGKPIDSLQRAIDRGVKLDVGHGAASFSFEVCKNAFGQGYFPDTISTDIHIRNINGPVFNISNVMTKLLKFGCSIHDIIKAVTLEPAKILDLEDWCDLDNGLENATLFQIVDQENQTYKDSYGSEVKTKKMIVPAAVIREGQIEYLK